MTETKFTPGPWKALRATKRSNFGSYCSHVNAQSNDKHGRPYLPTVAKVTSPTHLDSEDETNANAHLIASAPSMYDELVANNMLLGSLLSYGRIDEDLEHPIEEQIKANNLVIKSARGES